MPLVLHTAPFHAKIAVGGADMKYGTYCSKCNSFFYSNKPGHYCRRCCSVLKQLDLSYEQFAALSVNERYRLAYSLTNEQKKDGR